MMIDPDSYVDNIKDLSYPELVRERNRLLQKLHDFEDDKVTKDERKRNPSPEVVYQCNNLYLIEATKLLNDKFNENLWNETN